jgi:hypothetical protein
MGQVTPLATGTNTRRQEDIDYQAPTDVFRDKADDRTLVMDSDVQGATIVFSPDKDPLTNEPCATITLTNQACSIEYKLRHFDSVLLAGWLFGVCGIEWR